MHIDINETDAGFDVCLIGDHGKELRRHQHPTLKKARATAKAEQRMLAAYDGFEDLSKALKVGWNEVERFLGLAKLMGAAEIDGEQRDKRYRPPRAVATGDQWLINDDHFYKHCWDRFITVELAVARAIDRGWQIQRTPQGYVVTWSK